MAATLMDGKALAAKVRERVAQEARALGRLGLATILVGDDPASEVYIRHKHAAAEEVGIEAVDIRLPADSTTVDVLERVRRLNEDDAVDGILVQTPLPDQLDEALVQAAVEPAKDVDGLHPLNVGLLHLGRPALVPATPLGVMALLAEYGVGIEGARAVVIGRSQIVGRPLAQLLTHANATVTVCHSRTVELARNTLDADVLVAAVGLPGMVTADLVKQGAAVVDVGITRTDAGLVGDVDPTAAEVAAFLTPVPGGVGPMTIACLLENTVLAARNRRGELAVSGN
ncbi:MAG: bifunctional 5,10-methylenetetrahydrofolate dehydrogenase/5,10-methenyltetrahydrofolate cyclohydrolase [Thermoleophilia bacterium]|nr:bifunctional 5,10-methylenetetrahydrofolate dehydrogenase/5,10-methenyltetrahydrofolate cyclohydrolase [Thermoleophilia bacterium]